MKHIKKKTVKRLREGYHIDLIEMIEVAIDLYKEKEFDRGYQSCLEDMAIRSHRLAECIVNAPPDLIETGLDKNGTPIGYFEDMDNLIKVIDDYFNEALNK